MNGTEGRGGHASCRQPFCTKPDGIIHTKKWPNTHTHTHTYNIHKGPHFSELCLVPRFYIAAGTRTKGTCFEASFEQIYRLKGAGKCALCCLCTEQGASLKLTDVLNL